MVDTVASPCHACACSAAGTPAWARDLDSVRVAAAGIIDGPFTGAFAQAMRSQAHAAIAALEHRTAEAVAGFGDARARLLEMEQRFAAAAFVVEAAVLLPDHPEVRSWAAEARAFLESLGARPFVDRLDEALASSSAPAAASVEARTAEAPTA